MEKDIKKYNHEYYLKKREKIIEKTSRYAKENREKIRDRDKKYYSKNKELLLGNKRKSYHAKPFILRWARQTIYAHRAKGYDVILKTDELIEIALNNSKCQMCGAELIFFSEMQGKGVRNTNLVTLDRINNEKVIHKDNILILCWLCNVTKGHRTIKEFQDYCNMIAQKDLSIYV